MPGLPLEPGVRRAGCSRGRASAAERRPLFWEVGGRETGTRAAQGCHVSRPQPAGRAPGAPDPSCGLRGPGPAGRLATCLRRRPGQRERRRRARSGPAASGAASGASPEPLPPGLPAAASPISRAPSGARRLPPARGPGIDDSDPGRFPEGLRRGHTPGLAGLLVWGSSS